MSLKSLALGAATVLALSTIALAQQTPPVQAPAQAPGTTAPPAATAPEAETQDQRNRRGAMAACRKDMKALCADVPGGRGSRAARAECLVANKQKVSPGCAEVLAGIEERLQSRGKQARPLAACRTELQTLCATIEPGRGNRLACLNENQAKLSPACSEALAQLPRDKRSGG